MVPKKQDPSVSKAKKASEKLLREKFDTEWKQTLAQFGYQNMSTYIDAREMRKLMIAFHMMDEQKEVKKKVSNQVKVVN